MLPFKGSLFLKGILYGPHFKSFGITPIFLLEESSGKQPNLPKQQNLSSNEIPTKKSFSLFLEKKVHIGCLSRKRLPLKGSILLENLIGPIFLELPV